MHEESNQFAQLGNLLYYHEKMLGDEVRNPKLREVLEKRITPATSFLDVGAGSGIWSILAAKLGARRVVAIEIEENLMPVIAKLAAENGVAGKIELVCGNSNELRGDERFDVVLSEIYSADVFSEGCVRSFLSVRDRFLASGGVFIPSKLKLLAAPVRIDPSIRSIPAGLDLTCSYLQSLRYNFARGVSVAERASYQMVAEPAVLTEIDYLTASGAPDTENLEAVWTGDQISDANAIVTFHASEFDVGIEMDGFLSPSWNATVYEMKPLPKESRELAFKLSLRPANSVWSMTVPNLPDFPAQNYSNPMAFAAVAMHKRMTSFGIGSIQ